MALTLDASVGGVNSNSYTTEAEGDAYHEARLFATDWTGAVTATKEAALVWATRMLDYSFDWTGAKYTIEQALRWPRYSALDRDGQLFDSDEIPVELKDAVAELARLLIAGDRGAETGTEGLKRLKVDVIELEFDKLDRVPTVPDEIYQMISHLGRLRSVSASGGQVAAVPLVRT
jgi:Putative DnaT-like ssDNA binding protein